MGREAQLRASFLERVDDAARVELASDPELDAILERHLESGRAAWPAISLDDGVFLGHLAKRMSAGRARESLRKVHAADLYVACACAEGDAAAISAFDAILVSLPVRMPAPGSAPSGDVADEVRQAVREKLLVKTEAPPKIGEYAGRSDLRAWLRTVMARVAVDLARRALPNGGSDDVLGRLPSPANDPELSALKERYKGEFRAALARAAATLSARERNVLRQHYIDGLTMDELALLHSVHRVTVVRWVGSARDTLAAETRRHLLQEFGVGRAELESIMRLMTSQFDLSIRLTLSGSRNPM